MTKLLVRLIRLDGQPITRVPTDAEARGLRVATFFTPYVQEQLGWYVYVLIDPRDGGIFYVGKGQGNRVFDHTHDATNDETVETRKIARIREITGSGHEVKHMIVRHGLASSKHAFDVEGALIDALGLSCPGTLLNAVSGHHRSTRGLVHTDVVTSLFDAPTVPGFPEPSILCRIPQLWTPQMTSAELYETTRGWWKLGERRNLAKYAFAVNKGVIRGAYRIESWRQRREGDRDWEHDLGKQPRWGFDGRDAPEMGALVNTSVKHLFKRGQAGVALYVNC